MDHEKTKKRLLDLAKKNGFAGYWIDSNGVPLGTTNGVVAVFLGAESVEEAVHRLDGATVEQEREHHIRPMPEASAMIRILESVASQQLFASTPVHRSMDPDEDLMKMGVEMKARSIAVAEKAVADYPESKVFKEKLRKAIRSVPLHMNAIAVGNSRFNLSLVKQCLRTIGVTRGRINVGPESMAPATLTTAKGIAVLMPFVEG